MQTLQIQKTRLGPIAILNLMGALEPKNFQALLSTIRELLQAARPQVVLECSGILYIGSSDLRSLLDLVHLARARGGDIKCAGLAPTIEQVATLLANGDPLECFETEADAVDAFQVLPARR